MELWIRSQDREKLIKCNDIAIRSLLFDEIPKKEWNYSVVGYFDKETEYETLGYYKTKERALEVLDEIQEFIENKGKIKITQDINGITSEVEDAKRVYQMPLE